MKYMLVGFFAVFFQMSMVQNADARIGGSFGYQDLHFISETSISGSPGDTLSLCHLTKTVSFFFIDVWRSMDGYVLSSEECEGVQYLPFTKEQFAEAQTAGTVLAELPIEPKLSLAMLANGSWGLLAPLSLFLFVLFSTIGSLIDKRKRRSKVNNSSLFQKTVLDVMCHAAVSDGVIDALEVQTIQNAAHELTGRTFTITEIKELIESCDRTLSQRQFNAFCKGLDEVEKITLMKGALMIVSADSEPSKSEYKFISGLAAGLGISVELVRQILNGNQLVDEV